MCTLFIEFEAPDRLFECSLQAPGSACAKLYHDLHCRHGAHCSLHIRCFLGTRSMHPKLDVVPRPEDSGQYVQPKGAL